LAEISFLGAAREVGRSCILVKGRESVLLDCGVKLGQEEEYPLLDYEAIKALDKVVLSHAHLDHSGYLPALYASGYKGKVFLTKPTRDLIQLLLADYLRIKESTSPYKQEHVAKLLTHTEMLEYHEEKQGIQFYDAGHILGSAITKINTGDSTVLYTGDMNLRASRLLEGAEKGMEADTLIIESTYGAKADCHPSSKEAGRILVEEINDTVKQGGKVLIPTFAIGRGQEILFTLESYLRSGALEKTPIYLDGMVNKVLRIYRHNAIYLKKEVQRRILTSDDDPFKSEHYLVPQKRNRSDVFEQPNAVILATSGMLNGGPSVGYLEKLAPEEKNKIIMVGFQAQGTRGRMLLEGVKQIQLADKLIDVNFKVRQAPFSGHSDHKELVEFAKSIKGLKNVFIVHGEEAKSLELQTALKKHLKHAKVEVPKLGEKFEV